MCDIIICITIIIIIIIIWIERITIFRGIVSTKYS